MIKSYERLKKLNKEKTRVPRTVQDTIPVDIIYKDGIFRSGNKYTKSYRFLDINYKIASGEDKNNLFLSYSDLLNSFDSSVMTKITINNRKVDIKKFKEDILIPLKQDSLDPYREEYNNMLLAKLSESDDIVQEKYITVTIFKNSIEEARFISTCDHAIKMGIMDENPFNEIHISDPNDFKKRPKKYADWTYETMLQIFDGCKEEKLYVIMQIVFATGMNVTDVLGLVWSDFYHEKDKYYIRTNKMMERMYEKELFFLPESYVIKKYVHDKKIKSKTQVVHHYVDKENIYSIPRTLYELLQNWKKRSKDIFQFDTSPDALMFTTFGISPYDDRLLLKHLDQTTCALDLPRHTLAGLKFFSGKVAPDGRSYRDIYYYEHNDIPFSYSGLTAKEKTAKINSEFSNQMKKELPDKDKKDAVDLVRQLSEDKNIRKKLLMKLLEIESGE